ncbi:single-stranded DNA-binding protein [bacterium]|jgi:single-strand DNA-binding protein|nr:single-stranded DNA-binding protein [bacterium]MBT5015307.1 single-stranded DNA-binding protein [bacterium]
MAGFNRVIMIGNLTRDPDLKELGSGQSVCRLGLAANRQYKNRQSGEMVQEVCFIDIDVWGPQAESCNQYLQKGRQVLIEGRLKLDNWQDADGNNRSKHSIVADRVVFLSSNNDAVSSYDEQDKSSSQSSSKNTDVLKQAANADDALVKAAAEELLQKVEEKTAAPAEAKSPDAAFKDEPPFQDDLPF